MLSKKVHQKRNAEGDIVGSDQENENSSESDAFLSPPVVKIPLVEPFVDNSCVEQSLYQGTMPNFVLNDEGSVNDKLTQMPQPNGDYNYIPTNDDNFPDVDLDAFLESAKNHLSTPESATAKPKEGPFEVMFREHLLPLCYVYDPNESGKMSKDDRQYLSWKLEKHAYTETIKFIKDQHCYVQEMDEYNLKHADTKISSHHIYPGNVKHGFELGRIHAYAEHHTGETTEYGCKGKHWHTHLLAVQPAR